MLSRQDPRDAVVSVDPPALVEAVEQVNTDLTIGRGVDNAQSSAKRARTVNFSGTAPTSIDSYDNSLHDEMERYFAVPLVAIRSTSAAAAAAAPLHMAKQMDNFRSVGGRGPNVVLINRMSITQRMNPYMLF